jgi:hypothetical protein
MHACVFFSKMSHHWGILNQVFWLVGNKLGLGSASQCKWMLLQLVHELIDFDGFGLT